MEFKSVLYRPEGVGTWTYFNVPFDVEEVFGKKGQVAVKGTINNIEYKGRIMPHGDGTHFMVVNKVLRDRLGVNQGDEVRVTMQVDDAPRTVDIPEDFQVMLDQNSSARNIFEGFSYSHKKEWMDWITSAKKPETRARRIQKALAELLNKQ